jgi:ornithine cyclodeaminase/alanine dehydrogenase-like protein (mu-crystallin family)
MTQLTVAMNPTLVLTRRDVAALMAPSDWLDAVRRGFAALGEGRAFAPPPLHLPLIDGGGHAKAAWLDEAGRSWVALKFNLNLPGNPLRHGLPTIQGALLVADGNDGRVLAVIDSIELTLRRTAAATALAAQHLARPDARVITLCGCGAQAGPQLDALLDRFALERVCLWDRDAARAEALREALTARGRLDVWVAPTLADATRASDIVVTCTTATEPFLQPEHLSPGAFVAAVGADAPSKNELTPALLAGATLVVDSRTQCLEMGDLHHAVATGAMAAQQVHADLAELVLGRRPGRTRHDEVCVFDSTGVAVQDVAGAAAVVERARARGLGTQLSLSD